MSLSEQDKKELLNLLEKKKTHLEEQIKGLHEMRNYGDDVDGFDEETDESEAFGNTAAIEETLKHHLHHIENAVESIEEGNYGKCKECGHELSLELLKVVPESQLCQNCKVELRKSK